MKGKQRIDIQSLIEYQERVLTPLNWIHQAEELILASKKLEPGIKEYWLTVSKYFDLNKGTYNPPPDFRPEKPLQSVYFMLVAYGIENYFKAVLITENKEKYGQYVLTSGNLPKDLNGHDLIRLAKQTKLVLTVEELNLLRRLFRHSVWQGRYPVPVKANDISGSARYAGYDGRSFDIKSIGFWPQDIDELATLIRRIATLSSAKVLVSEQEKSSN